MGKGGTPKIEVTQYYLSQHLGICIGPPDALLRIRIKEKDAWTGEQEVEGAISINLPELFGGLKKEGGVQGTAYFLPGENDQLMPDALAVKLGRANGADCPGFRGLASLFFYGSPGFYWTANTPYLPTIDVTLRRILKTSTGEAQWYPATAEIIELGGAGPVAEDAWVDLGTDFFNVGGGTETGGAHTEYQTWFTGYIDSVRITKGVARYTTQTFTVPATDFPNDGTDPYWDDVITLLRFDGANGATSSTCEKGNTVTHNGGAALSTAIKKFGTASCFFDGIDDWVKVVVGAAGQNLGETFTIEAWVSPTARVSTNFGAPVISAGPLSTTNKDMTFCVFGDNLYFAIDRQFTTNDINVLGSLGVVPLNTWTHVAVTRDGSSGLYYLHVGGQLVTDGGLATGDMNPAHIIRECLTDVNWGMGTPATALDDDSFTDAADTLYAEGFGLSMLWTQQASIQDFVQEVLDHIQAVLFVDPSTGLLTIKLVRDDYDPDLLDVLTPDNADLTSFSRKLWGDIVNEIVVTWTNPENEQEETISVQDDSSIAIQGGIVSDSRNYYGVRNAGLAKSLAMRDLRSAGQPLAAIEAEVDRSQFALRPASVIKVTWPEYGLDQLVMRVQSVDYGKPGDMAIKLSLVEDVFGLDIGSYDDPPSSAWVDPSAAPEPMDEVEIITLPLFFALGSTVADFVESPEYPEVLAGVLATTDSDDTFAYELWDEVTQPNGDLEWQSLTTNNVIGRGELAADLDLEATTANVTFASIIGLTVPTVGGFVIIGGNGEAGNEIAMIDDDTGDVYDLVRGVLDTVPRSWPAGTPVWFVDGSTVFEDTLIRSAGETVSYKLLTRTSQGLLALASAPLESQFLTERPWLPNRPADVTAYGEDWSSADAPIDAVARPDPWVTVTWAIRNRLDEDTIVLSWTDASMTAETGQTTTIEVRDLGGVLLTTHDGLSGTTFNVPDASFGTEQIVELRVYSERSDGDGDFVSLQYFSHWVQVGPITADIDYITADSTAWTADEG